MIDHGHRGINYPLVAGLDGAGTIEAVGHGVTRFTPGDTVLALFAAGGEGASYQGFAVVDQIKVAKKPRHWSFEDAASLGYVQHFMSLGRHVD
jgi:NADPH:quinone reductase-like Zn-dependent oxidoreductase